MQILTKKEIANWYGQTFGKLAQAESDVSEEDSDEIYEFIRMIGGVTRGGVLFVVKKYYQQKYYPSDTDFTVGSEDLPEYEPIFIRARLEAATKELQHWGDM